MLLKQEVAQIVTNRGADDTFSCCEGISRHTAFFV